MTLHTLSLWYLLKLGRGEGKIFLFVYVVKCDNVCLETEFIIMWKSERTRVLKLLCNQMIYYQFEQTFFSFLWFHFTLLLRAICSYVH